MGINANNNQYQKIHVGFYRYYSSVILPYVRSLEKEKKEWIIAYIYSIFEFVVITMIMIFVSYYVCTHDYGSVLVQWLAHIFVILPMICVVLSVMISRKKVLRAINKKVIPIIIGYINPNFLYSFDTISTLDLDLYESNIELLSLGDFDTKDEAFVKILRTPKMMRTTLGKPRIDDAIIGKYRNLKFKIMEVRFGGKLIEEIKPGYFGFKLSIAAFKGIFFEFDFPRSKGLPQDASKKSTGLVITRNRDYHFPINVGQDIKLEDIEYERIYQTSGDDQIEARVLLKPAFMEKLKSFHHKGQKVACCFQGDKVYVAIQTNKDMFELPFWSSVKDIKPYREIVNQIQDILSIIDTLMG